MNDLNKLNDVDFIANKTKNNYINMGSTNNRDAIDCIHQFLCEHGVWNETDNVIHAKKSSTYVPDPHSYHNISFVITFYNIIQKNKKINEENVKLKEDDNSINIQSRQQINVKRLANPNISHTKLPDNNLVSAEPQQQINVKQLTNPNISHTKLSDNDKQYEHIVEPKEDDNSINIKSQQVNIKKHKHIVMQDPHVTNLLESDESSELITHLSHKIDSEQNIDSKKSHKVIEKSNKKELDQMIYEDSDSIERIVDSSDSEKKQKKISKRKTKTEDSDSIERIIDISDFEKKQKKISKRKTNKKLDSNANTKTEDSDSIERIINISDPEKKQKKISKRKKNKKPASVNETKSEDSDSENIIINVSDSDNSESIKSDNDDIDVKNTNKIDSSRSGSFDESDVNETSSESIEVELIKKKPVKSVPKKVISKNAKKYIAPVPKKQLIKFGNSTPKLTCPSGDKVKPSGNKVKPSKILPKKQLSKSDPKNDSKKKLLKNRSKIKKPIGKQTK